MRYSILQKERISKMLHRETEPVTALRLSRYAHLQESDKSAPKARKMIRELIAEGTPIGSSVRGYFLLKTEKEVQIYLNKLMSRSVALSSRIVDVYHAFNKKDKGGA